jgi:hypothetical protein
MKRFAKVSLVPAGVLLTVAVLALGRPPGVQGGPGPLPPQSRAYGKTLTEWLTLSEAWYLETSYAASDQPGQLGRVVFLPQPEPFGVDPNNPDPTIPTFVGQIDLAVRPGSPLVVPVLLIFGET